ncbi:hypothetical protein F5Y16DRAFT_404159 [Xylariaceae sp. FL0255]|nr:hypothetical protein F5Y16DRAFT_404159 [Xylariaceae sp. FL0255]
MSDKDLNDALFNAKIFSNFPGSPKEVSFCSNEAINRLITEDAVLAYFDGYNVTPDDGIMHYILDEAKKLFAIAIITKIQPLGRRGASPLLKAMEHFKRHGYRDRDLSAEIDDNGKMSNGLHSHLRKKDLQEADKEFWTGVNSEVCDRQWECLVPVLSTKRYNYSFRSGVTLPFRRDGVEIFSGGFGQVDKVTIEQGHFEDPGHEGPLPKYFAVKEIRPPDETERKKIKDSWAKEVRTLKDMNAEDGEHIVRCMTAFTRGDVDTAMEYYLVMEWADGGSLQTLFDDHPNPALDGDLMYNVIRQLHGLASALQKTHAANIRHGDLKPPNVLRFSPTRDDIVGTLKIGDWGLAKFHSTATCLRHEKGLATTTRFGTPLYEPPQVQIGDALQLSRLYDVWSFGVMMLEILIWLQYGIHSVETFRRTVMGTKKHMKPCYESTGTDDQVKARVRPIVNDWMQHMAKQCKKDTEGGSERDTAIGVLLAGIRDHLLVVELPPEMGETKYVKEWDEIPHRRKSTLSRSRDRLSLNGSRGKPSLNFSPERPSLNESVFADSTPVPGFLVTAPTFASDEPTRGRKIQKYRFTSEQLVRWIEGHLLDKEDQPKDFYFSAELPRTPPDFTYKLHRRDSKLSVSRPASPLGSDGSESIDISMGMEMLNVQQQEFLDSEWIIHEDTDFASEVLAHNEANRNRGIPEWKSPAKMCSRCEKLDFFGNMPLSVQYTKDELKARSEYCELCALFLKTANTRPDLQMNSDVVRLDQRQYFLTLNNTGQPVLTICRSLDWKQGPRIPHGLPALPLPGSQAHFDIMRQWLRLCDDRLKHPNCHHTHGSNVSTYSHFKCMPTRVLDVGQDGDDFIRLYEPAHNEADDYIALSHPWGHGPHLVTNVRNLAQHKDGIRISDLPGTFRDAVLTTRALGKRYLWIDSLCILQGAEGDFQEQAGSMETVFSSAYCVLAASRARNQVDGFLGPRQQRDYVTLLTPNYRKNRKNDDAKDGKEGTFYLCENIDDFSRHVLNAHLNRRGWVLQEHALARRTIFFADEQTYWECGDGVRCETLTRLTNGLAAFLGDPGFPQIIMSASQGEKILRFQNLYKTYSSLGFTNPSDRAVAMSGIQSRLLKAFGTLGGYGIFDEDKRASRGGLLRRSLLWHRPDDKKLVSIQFPTHSGLTGVPSWSWMAFMGEIDYLKPEFGQIDWLDIVSPWSSRKSMHSPSGPLSLTKDLKDLHHSNNTTALISGMVRDIIRRDDENFIGKLYFDIPSQTSVDHVRCMVLGIAKGERLDEQRKHFVLLVQSDASRGDNDSPDGLYHRVGAGYLVGKFLSKEQGRIYVH